MVPPTLATVVRVSTVSLWSPNGLMATASTLPTASRLLAVPSTGTSTIGPSGMPQTPKVWPKSELWRGISRESETSITPSRPAVLLRVKRPRVLSERWPLPCSRSLRNTVGSLKLVVKLCMPSWKNSGV
ncbi:hypothetical protein D3C81_1735500 [compost metagenome]